MVLTDEEKENDFHSSLSANWCCRSDQNIVISFITLVMIDQFYVKLWLFSPPQLLINFCLPS